MPKYRVRWCGDDEQRANLIKKGAWQFEKGGYFFGDDTVVEVDDLSPFREDPRNDRPDSPLDKRLIYDLIEEE